MLGLALGLISVVTFGLTGESGSVTLLAVTESPAPVAVVSSPTLDILKSPTSLSPPTVTPTPTSTPVATATPPNTPTSTPTPTATPTLDLRQCDVRGCGISREPEPVPTAVYHPNMLLLGQPPIRRVCDACPQNERMTEDSLNALLGAEAEVMAELRRIVLSQRPYEIAPGIVYMMYDHVHHVIIDVAESGFVLRNIIPHDVPRGTLITPSFCYAEESLVVTDADYHGLNGSNKTETGRDLFFHMGRAALFQRDGRFDLDVLTTRDAYDPVSVSWGSGPIFIWDGEYNYNPKNEWFDDASLTKYETSRTAKISIGVSESRKYLFISVSYNMLLSEHAQTIIDLSNLWHIPIDRAMRFDGTGSTYLAIRIGDHMVPVLNQPEPLIVNCFAVEHADSSIVTHSNN